MKFAKILIVALGLMLIAASSSFGAVVAFRTGTLNEVSVNAQTALVGTIGLVPLVAGTIPNGEIININYDRPISSVSDLAITVCGSTPFTFTGFVINQAQTACGVPIAFTVDADHISIGFNADVPATALTAGSAFVEVTGVRLNVAGTGGVGSRVGATISSVLGQISLTDPDVEVAELQEPLEILPATANISINTVGEGSATATVTIQELYNNAFETKDGATSDTRIVLTVTSPAGLTFSSAAIAPCTAGIPCATAHIIAPLTIAIDAQDANLREAVQVVLTWVPGTPPIPINLGSATVSATLSPPIGSTETIPIAVGPAVTNGYLRFANRPALGGPITISFGAVATLTSDLLSVFNVFVPENNLGIVPFNTGLVVANTSDIMGGAFVGQPGTIQVTFYPTDGSVQTTFTTSATKRPGFGLDASGMLPPNASWTVLLSDLLLAAGFDAGDGFQGMIVFHCNFSEAAGVSFIADPEFSVQSQGYDMRDLSVSSLIF